MRLDWWTRKALELLAKNHVFVVTYHYCPFAWGGATFVRKFGIYSTKTGMRVWGFEHITFDKVRRWLGQPAYSCTPRALSKAPAEKLSS